MGRWRSWKRWPNAGVVAGLFFPQRVALGFDARESTPGFKRQVVVMNSETRSAKRASKAMERAYDTKVSTSAWTESAVIEMNFRANGTEMFCTTIPTKPKRHRARARDILDRRESFANLYYSHLIDLADTIFSPSVIEPRLDNQLVSWVASASIQAMKSFTAARVAYPDKHRIASNSFIADLLYADQNGDGTVNLRDLHPALRQARLRRLFRRPGGRTACNMETMRSGASIAFTRRPASTERGTRD